MDLASKLRDHRLNLVMVGFGMESLAQGIDVAIVSFGLKCGYYLLAHIFKVDILLLNLFHDLTLHLLESVVQVCNFVVELDQFAFHVGCCRDRALGFSAISSEFKIVQTLLKIVRVYFFVKLDENTLNI